MHKFGGQAMQKCVEDAIKILQEQRYYDSIQGLMGWDLWEGLSANGAPYRGEVSGFFTTHQLSQLKSAETKKIIDAISEMKDSDFGDIYERGAARNLVHRYQKAVCVPAELQVDLRNYTNAAQRAWKQSCDENSFESYKPWIRGLFDLKMKVALAIDPNRAPFDVLCDSVDEGCDTREIGRMFAEIKRGINEILPKALEKQGEVDLSVLDIAQTHEQIRNAAYEINLLTGFDGANAHDSLVLHGMTTGVGPKDSRIGISYSGKWGGIFTMLHEGGHGRYSYNSCDKAAEYGLWGGVAGAMQESQARFYENIIGKSPEFWELCYPVLQKHFPELKNVCGDKFYKALMHIAPSTHRITADELTYSLHPIIRFEMEKDWFDGKIKTDDFEEIWNAKYQECFGLTPKDAKSGVLQDIHWASGHVGYFQSYTLGNLYGGQFLNTIKAKIPDLFAKVRAGDFAEMNAWLYENIHQYGNACTPTELLKNATGEDLNEQYFLDYLRARYL